MTTQTEIFRRLVQEHMGPGPVCIGPEATVGDVVARMTEAGASSAVIVDTERRAQGIVTEQDVTRRIAFRVEPDAPIDTVMTSPVTTIQCQDYLFHAIAFMRRQGLRHIPVVNHNQQVEGMLALDEALAFVANPIMELIDRLTHEETIDGLRKVKQAQVELADTFFADNVPAPEVQALLTEINIDIHRRILRRALAEMEGDGWGCPPVGFALIIMGSGGRGENFLFPDQDNGFILEDYPDDDHRKIDPFFIELAERMTSTLDSVGFPLCKGNIMATNPVWRKTLSQWQDQIRLWMGKRSLVMLRLSDIFFDFAHAFGESELSSKLRAFVTEIVRRNPGFLKDMFSLQADHKVALGLFGRLLTERDKRGQANMINLKYGGTLPLVEGVRLMALKHGVPATGTLARIASLHERGVFDNNQKDYLTGAFNHITSLLLRQQIADFKAGREVTNFVPKSSLSERERDYLVSCFRAIEDLRGELKAGFSTHAF